MTKVKMYFAGSVAIGFAVLGSWTTYWSIVWFRDSVPLTAAEVLFLVASALCVLVIARAFAWMRQLNVEMQKPASKRKKPSIFDREYEWQVD